MRQRVDGDRAPRAGRQAAAERRGGEHGRHLRVGEHIAVPALRIRGIHRHVGGARQVTADDAGDHVRRSGQEDRDAVAGRHAVGPQGGGDPPPRRLQRLVVQAHAAAGHGGRLRLAAGLPEHLRRQQIDLGPRESRPALPRRHRPHVRGVEHRHRVHGPVAIRRQVLEQRLVVIEQRLHPDVVEAIGAELDGEPQPGVVFGHQQRQVELGGAQVERDWLQRHVAERRDGVRLLVDEHHLENRVPIRLAMRRHGRRQHVEGQLRVGEQVLEVRREVLDARPDRLLLVHRGGHHERVQEVADHRRRGGMRPRRHRRGEGHPLALRVAVQQQPEHEGEDHERRGAGAGGEASDARLHRRPHAPLDQPPAAVPGSRRVLEGQPQVVRQRVEARAPEGERLLAAARAGLPEPVHVVVVLRGGGWVGQPARVGLRHFLPQEGQRPLVGQDVVQDEQQDGRVPGRLLDDLHADQRPPREIEGAAGLAGGHRQSLAILRLDPLDGQRRHVVDHLARAVAIRLERRSQQPVSRHHLLERLLKPRQVEGAADAERAAQVVGGRARVQLVHEPEAALHLAQLGRFTGGPGHQVEPARARAGLLQLDGPLKPVGAVVHLLGADHRERSRRRSRFRVNV